MSKYEIVFYVLPNGTIPVKDFLTSIEDIKLKAKTYHSIDILRENGYDLKEPYVKCLNDGIYELRTKSGNNITRVFYFFYNNGKIILTNGFIKKTQKTPVSEIKLAKKYRDDYIKRKGDSNG